MAKTQDTTEADEWPAEYRQRIAECDNPDRPWTDKDLMEFLYVDEQVSQLDISKIFDCSQSTIGTWVREHDFYVRNHSEAMQLLTEDPVPFYTNTRGREIWGHDDGTGKKNVFVHRLLAVAEFGFDAVCGMHVHHGVGEEGSTTPWDNRPENIELMTLGEHTAHHSSKVNWLDKIRMAEMYEHGDISHRNLAPLFDVSMGTTLRYHNEFYGDDG